MGAARDDENPDKGHGCVPKLILAGRLTGSLDGRPVVIDADDSGLLVSIPAFQTAWTARRTIGPLLPVLLTLKQLRVPLRLQIAGVVSVQLLPSTSVIAKLLAPSLHRLG